MEQDWINLSNTFKQTNQICHSQLCQVAVTPGSFIFFIQRRNDMIYFWPPCGNLGSSAVFHSTLAKTPLGVKTTSEVSQERPSVEFLLL